MSWALSLSPRPEPSSCFSSARPSMSGWRSSLQPTCVLLNGAVSWPVMSACPLLCLMGSLIEQRFWNLSELLIAFASNCTDRQGRRGKYKPKKMLDWSLYASCGPLFDDKLDHVSFQKLFWSIDHLVKISHKNWSTFLLQKTAVGCPGRRRPRTVYCRPGIPS